MTEQNFSDLSTTTLEIASEEWIDEESRQESFYESAKLGMSFQDYSRRVRTKIKELTQVEFVGMPIWPIHPMAKHAIY